MTITELRSLSKEELLSTLEATNKQIFEARYQILAQQSNNTAAIKKLKHQLAQIHTLINFK